MTRRSAIAVSALLISASFLVLTASLVGAVTYPNTSGWSTFQVFPFGVQELVSGKCVIGGHNYLFVSGGYTTSPNVSTYVLNLDNVTPTWEMKQNIPDVSGALTWRAFTGITDLADNRIYVIGGYFVGNNTVSPNVLYYDCASNTWVRKADQSLITGYRPNLNYDPATGRIYAYAGQRPAGWGNAFGYYVPATDTWTNISTYPSHGPVYYAESAIVGGYFTLFGGNINGAGASSWVQKYALPSGPWTVSSASIPSTYVGYSSGGAIEAWDKYAILIESVNATRNSWVWASSNDTFSQVGNNIPPCQGFEPLNFESIISVGNALWALGGTCFGQGVTSAVSKIAFTLPPFATTNAATGIGLSYGVLHGSLDALNGQTNANCGFLYDSVSPPVALNQTVITSATPQTYLFNASGFTPGETVYFRAWCYGNSDTAYTLGSILSFTTTSVPTAVPSAADNIGPDRARLEANITAIGDLDTSVSAGFWWGTNTTPSQYDNNITAVSAITHQPTAYTYDTVIFPNVGLLTGGTTYYYKAWALGAQSGYFSASASIINFTTLDEPGIVTVAADSITATSARLNANLTTMGGSSLLTCGFWWGTNATLAVHTNDTQAAIFDHSPQSFSDLLSNYLGGFLTPATTYYFRAWCFQNATEGNYVAFGAILNFTTPAELPAVSTLPALFVNSVAATMEGNLTLAGRPFTPTTYGFVISLNSNMSNGTTYTVGSASGPVLYSLYLQNLSANTTYYFFAWATSSNNYTANGTVLNFTTLDVGHNPGMDPFSAGFVAFAVALMVSLVGGAILVSRWRNRKGLE